MCLFACTPTEDDGPSTGTSNTVRSARFQSNTASVSITDVEAQDESTRDEAFMSAVRTLNVQVTIEGRSDIEVVKGDVLTYDFSGVDWETVGAYTATATLTELEGFDCGDGVALTNSLTINVTHGFGEVGEDGTATCPACNAVMTVEELPDSADPEVLTLYRAGILTGIDDTGLFAPERTLSRAELATVLARVADPSLRIATATDMDS